MARVTTAPRNVRPPALPADAFERYRGQWVALADGAVVAAAATLDELEHETALTGRVATYRIPDGD